MLQLPQVSVHVRCVRRGHRRQNGEFGDGSRGDVEGLAVDGGVGEGEGAGVGGDGAGDEGVAAQAQEREHSPRENEEGETNEEGEQRGQADRAEQCRRCMVQGGGQDLATRGRRDG